MLVEAPCLGPALVRSYRHRAKPPPERPLLSGFDQPATNAGSARGFANHESPDLGTRVAFQEVGGLNVNPSNHDVSGVMRDEQARIRSIDDEAITPADLVLG